MSARSGAGRFGAGAGTFWTMASRISSIPMPTFAEAAIASEQSMPMVFSTSVATRSTSAPGRSILFRIGTISRSPSSAKYTLAIVCASTPCDASTTRSAPSHAASERETS